MSNDINQYLYTWNPKSSTNLNSVRIEDDSLRDGLQGAFVRKPAIAEKKELLNLSSAVGTQVVMLGFPASSQMEFESCQQLLEHIVLEALPITPRLLARASIQDLEPIVALNRQSPIEVWADFFIGSSPLRRYIENWDSDRMIQMIQTSGHFLREQGTRFGISIEDATRTPPDELRQIIETALSVGAEILTLCDTVGEATPTGTTRLVNFVRTLVANSEQNAEIWWHGHNDRGLSLANAIAAAEASADGISGTFLGLGERTGNTPLEQFILYLHSHGSQQFKLSQLVPYCKRLAKLTSTNIPIHAPLIGKQAFATCTGTHAAAIIKARALGSQFEDLVFSSVPANLLGQRQTLLVGPTSGRANAQFALQ